MKRTISLILCILFCLACGCAKPVPAPAPTEAPTESEATQAPSASATEAPTDAPTEAPTEMPDETPVEPEEQVSEPDLVFDTKTLYGDAIDSSILKDYDLIIVNCWAEWCGPCVNELPAIEKLHQNYPNVLILGLLVASDSIDEAKATLKRAGVTYPVLEPQGTLEEYSMRSMYIPATYFFDRNGNEIGSPVVGGMSYDEWKTVAEGLLQ